jgi:site-specific DNA-methyltransferase (adenine-specific)
MGRIELKDCLEGLKELDAESLDICVTSPPYNLGIKYSTYQDTTPREDYLTWLSCVFAEVKRVLKPDGHFWLNMGYSNVDPWVGMDVANEARKHMVLQNNFIWTKSIAIDDQQLGHYKPINSERFANPTWEHLFHFTKSGNVPCNKSAVGVPYADKANLDKSGRWRGRMIKKAGWKDKRDYDANATEEQKVALEDALALKLASAKPVDDRHCPGNVWFIPYETIASRGTHRGSHPATFPVELVRRCIRFSNVEGTLLDPFMGTGTSAVAAQAEGLDWLGFDVDEHYIEFAKERLSSDLNPANK